MKRLRHLSCRDARRSGATIVETAVVFPVFLTFLFAVIEFGHAFMCNATLTAAAKDGARFGSVDGLRPSR